MVSNEEAVRVGTEYLREVLEPQIVESIQAKDDNLRSNLWKIASSLHTSVQKLKSPYETWPSLDVMDRLELCRYHRGIVERLIGS